MYLCLSAFYCLFPIVRWGRDHDYIVKCVFVYYYVNSVGAKSQILSSVAPPQEEKLGHYFQSGTCLGALETHVLLSFLWSIFCKWPVTNVTLLT